MIFQVKQLNFILNPIDITFNYKLLNNQNNDLNYLNDFIQKNIFINKSLERFLKNEKIKIEENENNWDSYKKYTNPYEFVYTSFNMNKLTISKIKPLSRAFFKFIEIYKDFNFHNDFKFNNLNSFHLAEGPGGFIEALSYVRNKYCESKYCSNDKYIGITLKDPVNNVPTWENIKDKITNNINGFTIENGFDNTGNILNFENFKYISEKYKNSIELITGDAGFDFKNNYFNQEYKMLKLIISQFCYAIQLQKENGHFILKVFDLFLKPSVQLIFLMTCFYKEVYICKPKTSRIANSEKYIICKYFKYNNETIQRYSNFIEILFKQINLENNNIFIESIYNNKLYNYFVENIEEINSSFGQKQLLNINETLQLINNNNLKKKSRFEFFDINTFQSQEKNIKNAIEWCKYYDIPYKNITSDKNKNIFIK